MIQIIKKSEQFNDVIFGGKFHANKPVFNGKANVKPYSSLYYWSNGYVNEQCELFYIQTPTVLDYQTVWS